jgi:hypothetical protein
MESIAKYLNEENDYFVVKAKRKMVVIVKKAICFILGYNFLQIYK